MRVNMSGHSYNFPNHTIFTKEEEYALFKLYNTTKSPQIKQSVKDRIIKHNLRFATRCANTYIMKHKHVDPDDLKGYAMMGLIEAIDRFDYTRGLKFNSFAVWWVKSFINRNVHTNESIVRLPANKHLELNKAVKDDNFTDDVISMFETIKGGVSIDQPLDSSSDATITMSDVLADESKEDLLEAFDNKLLLARINDAMDSLSYKERYIFEELYGINTGEKRGMRDVAEDLNVSHENVRYTRDITINKIRRHLRQFK